MRARLPVELELLLPHAATPSASAATVGLKSFDASDLLEDRSAHLDGEEVPAPSDPRVAVRDGDFTHVPILIGGTLFGVDVELDGANDLALSR